MDEEVIYSLRNREWREESKPYLKQKINNSLQNTGLDQAFLTDDYNTLELDKIEIYDILKKIYK